MTINCFSVNLHCFALLTIDFMSASLTLLAAAMIASADTAFTHSPLDEVIVTGTNEATTKNLLPYTLSVIGPEQLEATGQTKILSIISGQVPSLFATGRNVLGFGVSTGGSGHIKLRGVGGDRASGVLMMVDGQPQFAGLYSHQIADFYSKEYVESVEVLRGPASVLYGSNAMAGVINVLTKSAREEGARTSITVRGGSYDTWQASATNTLKYGKFSSLVSGGYDRTNGTVPGFDFAQAYGYGKVAYDFSPHWQGVADYTISHFSGNDPLYPRINANDCQCAYHQNVTRGEASLTATNRYGSITGGSARIYYSYGNHYIDDPRHFHSTDDRMGLMIFQNINPWQYGRFTAGFDFDRYTGRIPVSGGRPHTPGSLSTLERKYIVEYSPYITASQGVFNNILTINAGVRVAMSDKFHTQWVPQAGFAVNPTEDLSIKASVAKGYRNPSFRELYLYRMANPDLQPEQMINYEVSVGKRFNRYLSADITAYYIRGSQMINQVGYKNRNTGRFYNKGIELSLSSHPVDNLILHASYSYLHTTVRDLTGAPRHQYYIGADWQLSKHISLSADLKGTGRLFVDNDVKLQSYALLNARATYTVNKFIAFTLDLENITDTRYEINRGYIMPGITAMGGLKVNF